MIRRIVLQDPQGRVYDTTGVKYGVTFERGVSEPVTLKQANTIWANVHNAKKYREAEFQELKGELRLRPETEAAIADGKAGPLVFPPDTEGEPESDEGPSFDPPVEALSDLTVRDLTGDVQANEVEVPDDYNDRMAFIKAAHDAYGFPYGALNGGQKNLKGPVATLLYAYLVDHWLPSGDVDPSTLGPEPQEASSTGEKEGDTPDTEDEPESDEEADTDDDTDDE